MIVYLHGLNTFQDDRLHVGPLDLGRLDQHVVRSLKEIGADVISIDGIGEGSPEEQAEHAEAQLKRFDLGRDQSNHRSLKLTLLGNSMGGLTARALASRLKSRSEICEVKVVTWGTPHRGTIAATNALKFAEKNRRTVQVLSSLGYDLEKRERTFRHYTPSALEKFNTRYPASDRLFTLLCTVQARLATPYLWPLYPELHGLTKLQFIKILSNNRDLHRPSDGFIHVGSQSFGQVVDTYQLDHFAQIGFYDGLLAVSRTTKVREQTVKEFDRLMRAVAELAAT